MRKSIWLAAIPLLILSAQACGSDPVTAAPECTDDTECAGNDVCSSKGTCVPFKNSGSGSGGGSSTSSGTTTTSSGQITPEAACQDYLDCLAVVSPGAVATALPTYGSGGTCWTSDPQTAATCETACIEGMKDYHDSAPTVCPECYASADCIVGECNEGSCVVDLPVPDNSAACTSCRQAVSADQDQCAYYADQCSQDPDCVSMATCMGTCSDFDCFNSCASENPSGAETYLYGYMACVVCQYCYEECNGGMWCQFGG